MKDCVALITGGAGHIGKAIGSQLVSRGVHLAIVDKNVSAAELFADDIRRSSGTKAVVIDANLLDSSSFSFIRSKVEDSFGRLDFIVNNAAFYDDVPGWGVPFGQEGYDAWIKVMQVNLLAPFFLVQECTDLLRKSSCASVVNISSIYGVIAPNHSLYEGTDMTNPAAYAASKGGLIQMGKWLSTVLAPDVRVNSVTPGGVARGQPEIFVNRYIEKTPLQRMAAESDVASAVTFLLSPDSAYITGQNLVVDGGWTVW